MNKIRSIIAATVTAGAVVAGASACQADPPCLRGHYDYELVPFYSGKTVTLVMEPVWDCDQYAPASP